MSLQDVVSWLVSEVTKDGHVAPEVVEDLRAKIDASEPAAEPVPDVPVAAEPEPVPEVPVPEPQPLDPAQWPVTVPAEEVTPDAPAE